MTQDQYNYKGFVVTYEIKASEQANNMYRADGQVESAKNKNKILQKFHTEHPTKEGAKKEIKKLLEDYIDFEWQEFYEMQNEFK